MILELLPRTPSGYRTLFVMSSIIEEQSGASASKLNEHIKKGAVLQGSAKEMKLSSTRKGPKTGSVNRRAAPQ